MLRRAVERNIEIISEASRRLPNELKEKHPQILCHEIAAIGNILRHGYDIVDHEVLWKVATRDLAPLKRAIEAMIREVDRREGRRSRTTRLRVTRSLWPTAVSRRGK